ncbi:hypothetical protein GCM10023147_13330 [Tsukamurella soli]|uniref:Uncharacterized protein n=1 Tax=Tsukamurella soli TaxID=644556 RepID=A0ABP8JBC7_9ACTN
MGRNRLSPAAVKATHVRYYARLARHLGNHTARIGHGASEEVALGASAQYYAEPGQPQLRVLLTTRTHDCELSIDAGMTWMLASQDSYSFEDARNFLAEYGAPRFAAVLGTELSTLIDSVGGQRMAYPPDIEEQLREAISSAKPPAARSPNSPAARPTTET